MHINYQLKEGKICAYFAKTYSIFIFFEIVSQKMSEDNVLSLFYSTISNKRPSIIINGNLFNIIANIMILFDMAKTLKNFDFRIKKILSGISTGDQIKC